MILETEVWCSESDKNRDLGLPDGDCWMPISILFSSICAIKEAGSNDFIGDNMATIYLKNEHFIINLKYTEAVKLWAKNVKADR
jgi:hypothetical protein